MQRKKTGLLLLLGALLAQGCYYDMDSVPFQTVQTLAGTGTQGRTNGHATFTASFFKPMDVAVDPKSGKVYVADTYNHLIRLIHKGQVSTFAGSSKGDDVGSATSAKFYLPRAVAVGNNGEVYVADTNNHCIKVISTGTPPMVTVLAGAGTVGNNDGVLLAAKFTAPRSLAVDQAGKIFVADSLNNRIRVIDTKSGQVGTFTGKASGAMGGNTNGTLAEAKFKWPIGLTLDLASERIYVTEQGNHLIREISSTEVKTFAGSGQPSWLDGPAQAAQFNSPLDVVHDGKGKFYVADTNNHRIRLIYNQKVSTVAGVGHYGIKDGEGDKAMFYSPTGIAYDSSAGVLYVADTDNHRIRTISP